MCTKFGVDHKHGSRGNKCSPNKIIGEQVIHPAPPTFSVDFQIFWATLHTLVIVVIAASMTVRNNSSRQFDVSFPEKLLRSTTGKIFNLKSNYRLAAMLCLDPIWELKHSPGPLAAIRGPTSKGRGKKTSRWEESRAFFNAQ